MVDWTVVMMVAMKVVMMAAMSVVRKEHSKVALKALQ